jgi:hypothetical protein
MQGSDFLFHLDANCLFENGNWMECSIFCGHEIMIMIMRRSYAVGLLFPTLICEYGNGKTPAGSFVRKTYITQFTKSQSQRCYSKLESLALYAATEWTRTSQREYTSRTQRKRVLFSFALPAKKKKEGYHTKYVHALRNK